MTRITLLNITPELATELQDAAAFERRHGVRFEGQHALVTEVTAQNETYRKLTGAPPRWGAFLAADAETRVLVGVCAFKGAPDAEGRVEIAYFTFPPYEGRGYATAMADALVRMAAESGEVRAVRAHTLPKKNASGAILTKLDFTHLGMVEEPDDGPVWRWERSVGDGRPRT